jgi:lipopolysaccharide assembly outer membrane protein LptD (OstA)
MWIFSWALILVFSLSAAPVWAGTPEMPGRGRLSEAQLSADRMRFDSRSGDFLAVGNVVIQADGLTVYASRGTGNVETKEVHFTEGIAASGDWRGDEVNLAAGSISLYFAQTPTYIAEGGVKGNVGNVFVDADKFYMKGSDISAKGVRRLEDRAQDVAFGAESLQGVILDGELTTLNAQGKVWLRGRPNAGGEMVDIRGSTAVYSVERGSVVLSGNVRATQKGRTLTSQSIVYFPANNRLEAIGGIAGDGENMNTNPARITIDLTQEERRNPR